MYVYTTPCCQQGMLFFTDWLSSCSMSKYSYTIYNTGIFLGDIFLYILDFGSSCFGVVVVV
jgi:hypothetical protein